MVHINNAGYNFCGGDVVGKEVLYSAGRNAALSNSYVKHFEGVSVNSKMSCHRTELYLFWIANHRRQKISSKRNV